jgi:acyl-coenzyme A thioesterase PaaI-like protein
MLNEFRRLRDRLSEPSNDPVLDRAATVILNELVARSGALPAETPGWHGLGDMQRDNNQVLAPVFLVHALTDDDVTGTVQFTRAYTGRDAVHGGAIALFFDEVLGRLLNNTEPPSRTAYLHVNYRRLTPIDKTIDFTGRIVRREGRKRLVEGTLQLDGEVLTDAEGLWILPRAVDAPPRLVPGP